MSRNRKTILISAALLLCAMLPGKLLAQGYGEPLTIQGLHQTNHHSAATRAFGGVTIGIENNIESMFLNPAAMRSLNGVRISLGVSSKQANMSQEQHFAPVRYYPNLSLLLEGLTDQIPDPDPDLVGFTPADSVQRPYDTIQPDWSRSNTSNLPLQAFLAVPISLGGLTITAGLGAVEYANLDYFYQNNNVLSPDVLSTRPLPTLRPTDDAPVIADWSQSTISREGSIRGYGMALAGHIESYDLTIGISGMQLDGSSDDFEQQVDRGTLIFFSNAFRADSSYGRETSTGRSDFSGREYTLGATWGGRFASIGFALKPPTTYTRTFEREITIDSTGVPVTQTFEGEDRFRLPWRGFVGLMLKPRENLEIGLEYEIRPYNLAAFTASDGSEAEPWRSSSLFRIGAAYELASWLVLRAGMRGEAEVFVPVGSALEDEPVTYTVYSAGIGLKLWGMRWNLAYENANVKYEDVWGSAVSLNRQLRRSFVAEISYTIPFSL